MSEQFSKVLYSATNPDQWITVYADGRVRIHTRNMNTIGGTKYRTLVYRPKLNSDRAAIGRLIGHLNLVAAGVEGDACAICDL